MDGAAAGIFIDKKQQLNWLENERRWLQLNKNEIGHKNVSQLKRSQV